MDNKTNTVIFSVDGESFEAKKELTIAEQLLIEGKKQSLTAGQWGSLYMSPEPGDNNAAYTAQYVAELDVRIVKAPESWKGAELETDLKKVRKVWDEFAKVAEIFPKKETGADKSGADSDSGKGTEDTQSEDLVQEEVPATTK